MSVRKHRINTSRAVLAYERGTTRHFDSMSQCIEEYGIPSRSMLERMIDRGQTWKDGYTTFEYQGDEEELVQLFRDIKSEIGKMSKGNGIPSRPHVPDNGAK